MPEGSIGELLREGGGWLKDLQSESDEGTVRIVDTHLRTRATDVHSNWLHYGVTFEVEVEGECERYEATGGGIESELREAFELRASREAVPRVEDWLAENVDAFAEWTAMEGFRPSVLRRDDLRELFALVQAPPDEGSLFRWCRDDLLPRLEGRTFDFDVEGGVVTVEVPETHLPDATFEGRKSGWVDLDIGIEQGGEHHEFEETLPLGALTNESLTASAPEDDRRAELADYLETWWAYHETHLYNVLRHDPVDLLSGIHGWTGQYHPRYLLSQVEGASRHGPSGPPPVPEPDASDFERGAALLEPPTDADLVLVDEHLSHITARPFAAWRFGDYLLVFGDQPDPPHGASEIFLYADDAPPESDFTQVLLTDVWNPYTRWVVDGDAFAFRRFVQWMRGVLREAGLADRTLDKSSPELDYEIDSEMTLEDWFAFDEPFQDDAFLIDWRYQDYVVGAGAPIEGAGAMFGFTPDYQKQLEEGREAKPWRRFLVDVVDPRFEDAY